LSSLRCIASCPGGAPDSRSQAHQFTPQTRLPLVAHLAWPLARPALHALDPERAHALTLRVLESLPIGKPPTDDLRLRTEALGLSFPNPVGLAAGFDKDARVPDTMLGLGLGFVEVGSVTPLPQAGNPRPRIFRLQNGQAMINRLGFNNEGHEPAFARLAKRAGRPGIVGVNLGANRDSADRIADYARGISRFVAFASYFTINVSSPNTSGLRDLQARAALDDLLARVLGERDACPLGGAPYRPVLLKIAPDLTLPELDDVVAVALARKVDGLVVGNTTLSRAELGSTPHNWEAGGLSGRPLFRRATWMLAQAFVRTDGQLPLVGVGGIHSGETALAKLHAGATLMQLYTGLADRGPGLIGEIKRALAAAAGAAPLSRQRGRDAEAVCREGPGD
jgi:dihydroorotate dehydrogenase